MTNLSYGSPVEVLAKNPRHRIRLCLLIIAIVLLSGLLAAYALLDYLKERAALSIGSRTGMTCRISSVSPCFPCGIKASGITICSASGLPLFHAKEIWTQVNPLRYLLKNDKPGSIFDTLYADQVKLILLRNEQGEWDFPQLPTSRGTNTSTPEDKAFHRRFSFTNVSILVKTGNGQSERFYKSLEAIVDPVTHSLTLHFSGVNESAKLTFTKGGMKQYELQADNFSMALLAPISASLIPLENLLLDGKMRATTNDNASFAVEGSGRITVQSLRSPVISSKKIEGLKLPFNLNGTLNRSGVENLFAKISLAGETAVIQGDLRGWNNPVIDFTATFDNFSYGRAISAIPPSLHPDLPVIMLSGSMTGTFSMHLDMADPDSLEYSYTGRNEPLQVVNLGQKIDIERLKGPFTHKVRINPEVETSILLSPDNPDFTPYRKIPFSLRSAVTAAEDHGFFSHKGFSTRNIRGSLVENLKAGKVVRGASTISMQLAKNLFLSPERTLCRKLEEALITVALEQTLYKQRIMEIYLNIIEWGEGIYGIGQAARYYFGKLPAELSPIESAFLASIIARPKDWRPDPLSRLGKGWLGYLQVILCKMYRMGAAGVEDLVDAGVSEARIARLLEREIEVDSSTVPSPSW